VVPEAGNPQAFNRYAYVRNNPLKYTDPTGYYDTPSADTWMEDILRELASYGVSYYYGDVTSTAEYEYQDAVATRDAVRDFARLLGGTAEFKKHMGKFEIHRGSWQGEFRGVEGQTEDGRSVVYLYGSKSDGNYDDSLLGPVSDRQAFLRLNAHEMAHVFGDRNKEIEQQFAKDMGWKKIGGIWQSPGTGLTGYANTNPHDDLAETLTCAIYGQRRDYFFRNAPSNTVNPRYYWVQRHFPGWNSMFGWNSRD